MEGTHVTVNLGAYNVASEITANAPVQLKLVQNFSVDCSGSMDANGQSKM